MKTHLTVAISAFVLSVGAPAHSTLSQDTGAVSNAEATDDGINASNRIVCRRLPPPVGQRFGQGRRVCATEIQWEHYEREIRDTMNEAFNRSKVYSN